MGRTLHDDMAADAEGTILDELSGFAETVVYAPKNGPRRNVVMIVERREDFRETEQGLSGVETAECFCLRDRANVAKGGIESPQMGDAVFLSATNDPKQRPFIYAGIVTEVTRSSWVLHFSRDIQFRQGGNEQTSN